MSFTLRHVLLSNVERSDNVEYTIGQLATLSNVTTRTLRYYDQIELLKPNHINDSGYRIYTSEEVDKLQQIVFFRELDVSIMDIINILNSSQFNQLEALSNHAIKLKAKRDRIDNILKNVEKTIASKKGELYMTDKEKFEGFKEQLIHENEEKYGTQIRSDYGDETIDNSNYKFQSMTQEDYESFKRLEQEIIEQLIEATHTGNPSSRLAQQLVEKHKQWLMYTWNNYTEVAHAGLAEIYISDESFSSYYDQHVEGGAQFLRDAIIHYLDRAN